MSQQAARHHAPAGRATNRDDDFEGLVAHPLRGVSNKSDGPGPGSPGLPGLPLSRGKVPGALAGFCQEQPPQLFRDGDAVASAASDAPPGGGGVPQTTRSCVPCDCRSSRPHRAHRSGEMASLRKLKKTPAHSSRALPRGLRCGLAHAPRDPYGGGQRNQDTLSVPNSALLRSVSCRNCCMAASGAGMGREC
jgi:hypothetical protein